MNNNIQKKSTKRIIRNIFLGLFGLGFLIQAVSFNLQKGRNKANQGLFIPKQKKQKLTKKQKLELKIKKINGEV